MTQPGYPESYYAATIREPVGHAPLDGSKRVDVCVVGGGYTGLSAALHLASRGYKVALLEAQKIGWGASGRNGGQLGTTLRKAQPELEAEYGKSLAEPLWQLAIDSTRTVKGIIEDHNIDCDLTPGILHAAWKKGDFPELAAEADELADRFGYRDLQIIGPREIGDWIGSDRYHGGVLDRGAAHLHPLNFALGMARAASEAGADLHEETEVTEILNGSPATVRTARGDVTADHVIVGCNGYLGRLLPDAAGFIMPINNFILVTEPLGSNEAARLIRDRVAVADTKFVIDYYRVTADDRLLFGGGETYSPRFPKDIEGLVRKPMSAVFPHLKDVKADYAWGGTLAITLSRMPAFGTLGTNVWYAHGFSGQGINVATLAGKLMAEAIDGNPGGFEAMAALPLRKFPGGTLLRYPGLVAGMLFYAMRDRLP